MGFWWFMFVCNMLVPATMIIAGYRMWKHCPHKINPISGYSTKRSMKNMDTWKFAHNYCGRLCWKAGWILAILTALVQLPFTNSSVDEIGFFSLVIISVQAVTLLLSIILTENALKKIFNDDGSLR